MLRRSNLVLSARQQHDQSIRQLTRQITRAATWEEACTAFVTASPAVQSTVTQQHWLKALLRRCGRADWSTCLAVFGQIAQQQEATVKKPLVSPEALHATSTRAALAYGTILNWRVSLSIAVGASSSSLFPPLQLPLPQSSSRAELMPLLEMALRSSAQAGAWDVCLSIFSRSGMSYSNLQTASFSAIVSSNHQKLANVPLNTLDAMMFARITLSVMLSLVHYYGRVSKMATSNSNCIVDAAMDLYHAFYKSERRIVTQGSDEFSVLQMRLHAAFCHLLNSSGRWQDALLVCSEAPWPGTKRFIGECDGTHRSDTRSGQLVTRALPETRWSISLRALLVASRWQDAIRVSHYLRSTTTTTATGAGATAAAAAERGVAWERAQGIEAWKYAPFFHGAIDAWLHAISHPLSTTKLTDAMRMRCSISLSHVFSSFESDGRRDVSKDVLSSALARGMELVAASSPGAHTRLWTVPLLCFVAGSPGTPPDVARTSLERALDAVSKLNVAEFVSGDATSAVECIVAAVTRRASLPHLQPLSTRKIAAALSAVGREAPWLFHVQLLLLMELRAPSAVPASELKERSALALATFERWKAFELINSEGGTRSSIFDGGSDEGASVSLSFSSAAVLPSLRQWLSSHRQTQSLAQSVTSLDEIDRAVAQQIEAAVNRRETDRKSERQRFVLEQRQREEAFLSRQQNAARNKDDDEVGIDDDEDPFLVFPSLLADSSLSLDISRGISTLPQQPSAEKVQQSLLRCAEEAAVRWKEQQEEQRKQQQQKQQRAEQQQNSSAVRTAFQAAVAARKNGNTIINNKPKLEQQQQPPSFVPNQTEWNRVLLDQAMHEGTWQHAHFLFLRGYQTMSLEHCCQFVRFDLNRGGNQSAMMAVAVGIIPRLAAASSASSASTSAIPSSSKVDAAAVGVEAFLRCSLWRSALRFVAATVKQLPPPDELPSEERDRLQKALGGLLEHPDVPSSIVAELCRRDLVSSKHVERLFEWKL